MTESKWYEEFAGEYNVGVRNIDMELELLHGRDTWDNVYRTKHDMLSCCKEKRDYIREYYEYTEMYE